MGAIQVYQYFVVDTPNGPVRGGSLSEARSVSIGDDEVSDETVKISAATAVKLWDKDEVPGNADFIWIESDLDVLLQFTTADAYDIKKLTGSGTAGKMGPALMLGSDDTHLQDGTVDLFDGTAGVIQEIWAYNSSATATATVRRIIAT